MKTFMIIGVSFTVGLMLGAMYAARAVRAQAATPPGGGGMVVDPGPKPDPRGAVIAPQFQQSSGG